jgi:hypothetical protein
MVGRLRIGGVALAVASMLTASGCFYLPPPTVDRHAIRISGEYGPSSQPSPRGTLRVVTERHDYAYGEHGIYSLHEGYDIYDEQGNLLRRVANHRTPTDESVTDVTLAPGSYLVAVPDGPSPGIWIEIRIEDGRVTEADVTKLPSAPDGRG